MKRAIILLVGWAALTGCATSERTVATPARPVVYEWQYVPGYWVAPRYLLRPVADK